ncbi:lipoprotein 17-related variable surface protein [Mycoplasmopsis opalescens]|uniref:lipoprotein 17-related variable surface protein n=1 Tax=Mycoplasmopsis opalescens TaxID=114886 RepID=UPI0004A6FA05|nr:lipoprotein 17-related variable surface protein [Mycoplasmopsis opalescens]
MRKKLMILSTATSLIACASVVSCNGIKNQKETEEQLKKELNELAQKINSTNLSYDNQSDVLSSSVKKSDIKINLENKNKYNFEITKLEANDTEGKLKVTFKINQKDNTTVFSDEHTIEWKGFKIKQNSDQDTQINSFDAFYDEVKDSLRIIPGKETEFVEKIKTEIDLWWSRSEKQFIYEPKGTVPNFRDKSSYKPLLEVSGLAQTDFQFANPEAPTFVEGKFTKISNKIQFKIEGEKVVLTFKIAKFIKNKEPEVSEKIYTLEVDFPSKDALEIDEKAKEATFDYPDIKNTYIKDFDESKLVKKAPDGFEFSYFKAVPSEETNDVTIIYKIKKTGTNIENKRNQHFDLKGWKLTPEQEQELEEKKNQLSSIFEKMTLHFADEMAYQFVVANKAVENDNKPNFVIKNLKTNDYGFKFISVEEKEVNNARKWFVKIKLWTNLNKDVFIEKDKEVDLKAYSRGINPHGLTADEQKNYLQDKLDNLKLNPKFSKDKYFIENGKYNELSNESYWLSNPLRELALHFQNNKKADEKHTVEVVASFKDWTESPKVTKEIEIDLSKTGVQIHNEKNPDKPWQDVLAPQRTIPDQDISKDLILPSDWKGTDKDDTDIPNNKIQYKKPIEEWKSKGLYTTKAILDDYKAGKNKEPFLQSFIIDKKGDVWSFKSTTRFLPNKKQNLFQNEQQLIVISDFKSEIGHDSVKITLLTVQELKSKDFSSLVSARVNVSVDPNQKDPQEFNKKLVNTNWMKDKIQWKKESKATITGQENMTLEQAKQDNDLHSKVKIENLPSGWKITKAVINTNKKGQKQTLGVVFSKDDLSTFQINFQIEQFKTN